MVINRIKTFEDPRDANLRAVGTARSLCLRFGCRLLFCLLADTEEARREAEEEVRNVARDYLYRTGPTLDPFVPELQKIGQGKAIQTIRDSHSIMQAQISPEGLKALTVEKARDWCDLAETGLMPALSAMVQAFVHVEHDELLVTQKRIKEAEAASKTTLQEVERIADTVRLIAINVSIEAARAGGATGRSFAVIAEEIRTLSERSADLITRIRNEYSEPDTPPSTPAALALNDGANGKGHGRNEIHAELAQRPS